MTTAGLILAAGEGRRFGSPKAAYVLDGERLVDRAVRIVSEAGCAPIFVVLGAWIDEVAAAEVIINEEWSEGMGSSLRVGLSRLQGEIGIDRVLVCLVDLPGLTVAAVQRVMACESEVVAASYDGAKGHPVILHRNHWGGVIRSAQGDKGARDYLAAHTDKVTVVEVGDIATGEDLDTPPG